jgi:hypothetical protein
LCTAIWLRWRPAMKSCSKEHRGRRNGAAAAQPGRHPSASGTCTMRVHVLSLTYTGRAGLNGLPQCRTLLRSARERGMHDLPTCEP